MGQCGDKASKFRLYLFCRWERHLGGFSHLSVSCGRQMAGKVSELV